MSCVLTDSLSVLSLSRSRSHGFAQADKLSTTGYGHQGEGEERTIVAIASVQKLTNHEKKEQHMHNVERQAAAKAGVSLAGATKPYLTITTEDELCTCLPSLPMSSPLLYPCATLPCRSICLADSWAIVTWDRRFPYNPDGPSHREATVVPQRHVPPSGVAECEWDGDLV